MSVLLLYLSSFLVLVLVQVQVAQVTGSSSSGDPGLIRDG